MNNFYKQIELPTYDDSKQLSLQLLYVVEDYFTFSVFVKSNDFQGRANFCTSALEFEKFVMWISVMKPYEPLRLNDADSDSYISISKTDNLWHYELTAKIWWSHESHSVSIKFSFDQTAIAPFVSDMYTNILAST